MIVDINTRYSEMLGWEQHELVGRPVIDLIAPEFHELVTRHMREGFEQSYEVAMRRKNGETFPCEVRGKMTDWQGRRLRVSVIRDMTETKRVKAQLAEQKAALARFQHMALLSEISAGVVHQISQPISAIVNNVAAARAMAATCDRPECASLVTLLDIDGECERLRDTIDRLRALAHPERQNHTPQCLGPILQDAMQAVESDVPNQGVTFSLDCPADLPRVMADAIQLGQAFLNLLHNAFDAVTSRPLEQGRVTVSARELPGDEVEITIRDSGSGISPEAQSRLFEPLYTTKDQGNGIGLALCRTIITAHHGRISGANNMDLPGATFQVILPAVAEAP
jgi:two-component system sensor kinase FixL